MKVERVVNEAGQRAIEIALPPGDKAVVDGPDEDGDVVVAFERASRPTWHLCAHGVTRAEALLAMADVVSIAEQMELDESRR